MLVSFTDHFCLYLMKLNHALSGHALSNQIWHEEADGSFWFLDLLVKIKLVLKFLLFYSLHWPTGLSFFQCYKQLKLDEITTDMTGENKIFKLEIGC